MRNAKTLTGSQQRRARAAQVVTAFTRAQAARYIAATDDSEAIAALAEHPNKHIQAYVAHKLGALEAKAKRVAVAKKAAATRRANAAKKAAATG